MTPSAQFIADLKRREGFRSSPYRDGENAWTIGYGQHDGVTAATPPVTEAQASAQLAVRAGQALNDAAGLFGTGFRTAGPVRQDALADLCYNMGATTLKTFVPMIEAVARGDWQDAASHLLINTRLALTPYLTQTKSRAVEIAMRLACGTILPGQQVGAT